MSRIATFIMFLCLNVSLHAHGELDKRIKEISIKILEDPTNTSLFLARGELYYQHEDYQLSIKDFKVCEKRGFVSDRLNLNFAKSYRLLASFNQADEYAEKILSKQSTHVLALKVKAKTAFDRKEFIRSADLFKSVIKYVDVAHTDNYFEASSAFEACGSKECLVSAIEVIESGIEDLGELMVFLDKGVSISLRLKDFAQAHEFQNKIIENANRKERKYFQKALLYKEQGKVIEAEKMLKNSLVELDSLPNRIKQNRASKKLRIEIERHLSSIP